MTEPRVGGAPGLEAPTPGTRTAASRFERAIFGVVVASVFASLCLLVHPWFDPQIDGAIYIVTARSLAAGEGYTYLGEPFQARPPGFPLLLAPLLAGAGSNFLVLNFFVGLFGALGVVLLFWFERPRLGFGLALLTAVAVWLSPGYQRLATQIMSDVPGSTLLLLCLLVERWARRAPSGRRELVLGLCIGLSVYVRSLLLLLVPAIVISRLLQRSAREPGGARHGHSSVRRLLPFAAVVALVVAPWSIRNALHPAPMPAEQTALYSYAVAMLHKDPGDASSPRWTPGEILERVPARARQLTSALGSRLQNESDAGSEPTRAPSLTEAAIALLFVGSSLVVLFRRREPAEIFVVASLLVLSIYFSFAARLALPVYLLAFPACVEVLRDLVARMAGARAGALAAAAALLLVIAVDFDPRRGWDEIEREHDEIAAVSRAIENSVPAEARLGSVFGAFYSVFLERPVYTFQIATRRARSPVAIDRLIEKHRIDTIVLTRRPFRGLEFIPYVTLRYGEPQPVGPALIWQIGSEARPPRT